MEWWIFRPKESGEQVKLKWLWLATNLIIILSLWISFHQTALLVVNLGEPFKNIMALDETVLPFEWHSFCITINIGLKQIGVFHNVHIQAVQLFDKLELQTEDKIKVLTSGHLLGPEFVGTVTDVEVFGRPLPEQELLKWTLCQNQV